MGDTPRLTDERDFESNPYSPEEARVAAWLSERGVGGGNDPIGFILASLDYRRAQSEGAQAKVVEALLEALTPSADTKAAYIGVFGFRVELANAEGETYSHPFTVPWTTVKEIMSAIRNRALSPPRQTEDT